MDSSNTLRSLLPCPFCGGKPFDRGFRRFECNGCGAEGPARGTKTKAADAWNTRAASQQQAAEPGCSTCHGFGALETVVQVNGVGMFSQQPCPECSPIREPATEPVISTDGPHEISKTRKWLARQLLDSMLSEKEALGVVAYSPALDGVRKPAQPDAVDREALGRAIYLAMYEHQGAVWAANESKDVWYETADRFLALFPVVQVGGEKS